MELKIYQLSHIDLDGYGAQWVTTSLSRLIRAQITFKYYNANYGSELVEVLDQLLEDIKGDKTQRILLLITDLNLPLEVADKLVATLEEINSSRQTKVELQLFDHHITGREVQEKYPSWYHLDESKSGTLITFHKFIPMIHAKYPLIQADLPTPQELEYKQVFEHFAMIVNAYDMWLQDDRYFELAKVFSSMIFDISTPAKSFFNETLTKVKLLALSKMYMMYYGVTQGDDTSPLDELRVMLDRGVYDILRECYSDLAQAGDIVDVLNVYPSTTPKETLSNIEADVNISLLTRMKSSLELSLPNGQRGVIVFKVGDISTTGNLFLKRNPEYLFYMELSTSGTEGEYSVKLRSVGELSVANMCKVLFQGGGHVNAAGGRFMSSSKNFSALKEEIQSLLNTYEV